MAHLDWDAASALPQPGSPCTEPADLLWLPLKTPLSQPEMALSPSTPFTHQQVAVKTHSVPREARPWHPRSSRSPTHQPAGSLQNGHHLAAASCCHLPWIRNRHHGLVCPLLLCSTLQGPQVGSPEQQVDDCKNTLSTVPASSLLLPGPCSKVQVEKELSPAHICAAPSPSTILTPTVLA